MVSDAAFDVFEPSSVVAFDVRKRFIAFAGSRQSPESVEPVYADSLGGS